MFGFKFIKVNPTTHLMAYRRGHVVRQGAGMSLLYYAPTMSLVAVPIANREVPFIFEKVTSDFQTVSVQGQLSFRIADPAKTAGSLNFSLLPNGKGYESKDPEKVGERVSAVAQVLVQHWLQAVPLTEAIRKVGLLAEAVFLGLKKNPELVTLGIDVQGFAVLAVKPTPETARALEAKAREQILREADEAVFERRNAAVENERAIKESELDTEVAVELKKRAIRETQLEAEAAVQKRKAELKSADMTANVALETQRKELVQASAENTRTTAEAEAHRIGAVVKALQTADPRTVQALAAMGMQPSQLIAQAFGSIAEHAEKIGQLNLSPDLLQTLLTTQVATKDVKRG